MIERIQAMVVPKYPDYGVILQATGSTGYCMCLKKLVTAWHKKQPLIAPVRCHCVRINVFL